MSIISAFFARLRFALFRETVRSEIEFRIFSHLRAECDYGYPFDSHESLLERVRSYGLDENPLAKEIDPLIRQLPRAWGISFRYVFFKELKETDGKMQGNRFRMYKMLARQSIQPKNCDPQYVAMRA